MVGSSFVTRRYWSKSLCPNTIVIWIVLSTVVVTSCSPYGSHRNTCLGDYARVIPDTNGAIAEIVLHYLPDMENELSPLYRDLLSKLPKDVRIQVICPSQAAADKFLAIRGATARSRERELQVITVDREITLWARDRRIARHHPRSYRSAPDFVPTDPVDSDQEKRNEVLMVPDLVRKRCMSPYKPSTLHLEGGNVVSNRRHVFVGTNVLTDNAILGFGKQQLARELPRILGSAPVFLGKEDGTVPFCHVDMYLTPLDNQTMLVASTTAGLSLLLGRTNHDNHEPIPEWIVERLDDSSQTAVKFDDIASQVETLGYSALRLPALVDHDTGWMITYNNVLIDRRNGRSTVFMPIYNIPALDITAAMIYRSLGFDVETVDVSQIYDLGGAVRCIANVIRRTELPMPVKRSIHPPTTDGSSGKSNQVSIPDKNAKAIDTKKLPSVWSVLPETRGY